MSVYRITEFRDDHVTFRDDYYSLLDACCVFSANFGGEDSDEHGGCIGSGEEIIEDYVEFGKVTAVMDHGRTASLYRVPYVKPPIRR